MAQALILLAVTILVFLICREIVCWYWKINEALGVLRENTAELRRLNQQLGEHRQPPSD